MADISTELARILSAIYGEDVRGSIHDAIEKINDVSEVVLTTGTAVTSPSSSSTGFYDDSLYLNTDTFELWKCTGVNTWASQGTLKGEAGDDGNGIVSIEKTSTSGLIDTYTITYTDGDTDTFTVTNGEDGANGNKWYRGTGISGKAALPTVYTTSGVADANSGDMFLNPSEGAVYSCVTGGIPTVATWQYEMTLSGGGGGTSDYADLTNKPSINGYTLSGNQTGADLGLASSSDIPTVDQTYNATSSNAQSGKAVASAISGKADTSLLKSTVGWTGKNKFNYNAFKAVTISGGTAVFENNGITLTATSNDCHTANNVNSGYPADAIIPVEEGKPIKLIWKTTETVYMGDVYVFPNGGPAGMISVGSKKNIINYTPVSGVTFITVRFGVSTSGNTVHYKNIMVMDASITDDTYEPYHESVEEKIEQIYADNGVLGAKNLWDESHSFNTKTGVTYTLTDHIYTINTAAEDYSGIYIGKTVARQYYSNYVGIRAKMVFEIKGDSAFNVQTLNNVVTSVSTEYKRVEIPISDLSQIDDIVFYNRTTTAHTITVKNLMIVLASDPDDTYVPYAMTNKEITEELTAINNGLDDWTSTETVSSSGTVSFSGLNDSYGYKIYYTLPSGDSAYTFSKVTKSGSGTSVTLTYTTDAPSGTVCKLRILK